MDYGSVCSGIEAATVAWDPLGWKPQWFSEIEPFPSKLLKHYYPNVPNLGDMMKLEKNEIFQRSIINLLVGGTPCQSFSLAGLRGGMADVRGNLALEFCRLLIAKRPAWFVWENVPGVFSSFSNEAAGEDVEVWETSDFATLLTAFRECGYCCAWRVLDSQHFGVPQRRRRVFVVGHIGNDWRPPFAVLFERESLRRDFTPGRKTREKIAGTIDAGARKSDRGEDGNLLVVPPIHAHYGTKAGQTNQDLKQDFPHLITGTWWDGGQTAQTLDAVLQKGQTMPEKNRFPAVLQQVPAINASGDGHRGFRHDAGIIPTPTSVRRLTPLECERLQGFPDHYTNIPGAKDGPRYKALGNSMTVNVMHWIGKRIDLVNKIFHK